MKYAQKNSRLKVHGYNFFINKNLNVNTNNKHECKINKIEALRGPGEEMEQILSAKSIER